MRTSGVLMPISSLPSPYGIGTMGKDAKKFVDFLEREARNTGRYFRYVRQAMAIRRISHFQALQVIHILSILTICVRISSLPKRNVSRMIGERVPKK